MKTKSILTFGILAAAMLSLTGCRHSRVYSAGDVELNVTKIVTQRKYKIVEDCSTSQLIRSYKDITGTLRPLQPSVFNENGLEVVIKREYINTEIESKASFLSMITFSLWPSHYVTTVSHVTGIKTRYDYEEPRFMTYTHIDDVTSIMPGAYIFADSIIGNSPPDNKHKWHVSSHDLAPGEIPENSASDELEAYQIAKALKDLEEEFSDTSKVLISLKEYRWR